MSDHKNNNGKDGKRRFGSKYHNSFDCMRAVGKIPSFVCCEDCHACPHGYCTGSWILLEGENLYLCCNAVAAFYSLFSN